MFRLSREESESGVRLTLEGELKSDDVEAAEAACLEALRNSSVVAVLVKNITEIDAEGLAFLKRLAKTRAQVQAVGIFSEYVVGSLRAESVG